MSQSHKINNRLCTGVEGIIRIYARELHVRGQINPDKGRDIISTNPFLFPY